MPAKSARQQRFMGAELGRLRAGQKTKTGMSEKQLKEFAEMKGKMPVKGKMPPKGMPMKGMPASHAHMTPAEHKKAMKKMGRSK